MHLIWQVLAATCLFTTALASTPENIFQRAERIQRQALERHAHALHQRSAPPQYSHQRPRFLTDKTAQFAVDGKSVPDVNFDLGESYAGLLPISDHANETRKLYFWFFPGFDASRKEVTTWFNGGPGCSSLGGLITENGPFTWMPGTYSPTQNTYDWRNLTNMLWVEQPIGVGFTQGRSDITNEYELAEQFVGFYEQFVKTFDLEGWDVYLNGESYAGYYVTYVANEFIQRDCPHMPLKGIAINDPIIGGPDGTTQLAATIVPFVQYWQNVLNLNETTLTNLSAQHQRCGYAHYLERYLTFPPPQQKFPELPNAFTANSTCDTFDTSFHAILEINPCASVYHITDYCPFLWSVNGPINRGYDPAPKTKYFNRTDVKRAIHAPLTTNWSICTHESVFQGPHGNKTGEDQSIGPAQNDVLQTVIEHTNNVIIGCGNLDILLGTNGTLLALQNVTWNGMQGLQQFPGNDFYVPYYPAYNPGAVAGGGTLGKYGTERGVTFYQVQLAGHQVPGYSPGAAFRVMELLLGRIDNLGQRGSFSTQMGNSTYR
ncbi:serine carboxypeptidase [Lecanosticta acicola]|uniref:Carboxypeptidase n=1 Tax=Lecanosticta acicola TaxID=111012 RepID=A0AAI8YYD7_9PEZI|nr:serine carboxypeptidase [Lecanosticta acicola]